MLRVLGALGALILACTTPVVSAPRELRVGIIGRDTSHVIAFTKLINDPEATGDVAKLSVVAAWPGGTDIPASKNRVAKFTEQLRGMGVEITDSIPDLLALVDVVLLESVDGRSHLEQVRPVLEAGKPVFIDKPLAGTLADAMAIRDLAMRHGVPWFSCSALRFSPSMRAFREGRASVGKVIGCDAWSPCPLEPTHPDLFWYGVHGVEALFTIMGPGCERVTRVRTGGTDLVVGTWKDGRIGTFRGIRDGKRDYGATVFGTKGISRDSRYEGYGQLVQAIARFFHTGRPPISADETIELFAFMEAADESRRRDGATVSIASVLEKAKETAGAGR